MNAILETIIKQRNGHYCHTLEVDDIYELKEVIASLYAEFINDYKEEEIIDFLSSMSLYCLNIDNEQEVYNFNITNYILTQLN